MGNLTKKEINILIQLLWNDIEAAEKFECTGTVSKEFAETEIKKHKELLEKLIKQNGE